MSKKIAPETLCGLLLHSDTEAEVIEHLTAAGYWDDAASWRLYGDTDQNFAQAGNQQGRPDAALVEKLVNAVDARLMNACLVAGIRPESAAAPQTIRQAVAQFFGGSHDGSTLQGSLKDWDRAQLKAEALNITIAATGTKKQPCLTIADMGEGQTPDHMPLTLLSLGRSNKLKIPFVQGKFNMGGTGVLRFCGRESLQLVLSRRNPAIAAISPTDPSSSEWGVTVVRRERPVTGAGAVRNSVYRYLAPVGASAAPGRGSVLRFSANAIDAMPSGDQAYARPMEWGTVIKLYEYDMKGFASHVLLPDGLLSRLDLLLPEVALPIRVHECRPSYRGKKGSFETNLDGLTVRLEHGKGDNVESGFPVSVPFVVAGQHMVATVYAFKPGKADTYRTNEGIIVTLNGQTHGAIPRTFFERKNVAMSRLADSLLVLVDCSNIDVGAREDLFMTSRDRLSNGELRKSLEGQLEEIISHHPALRALREARRSEEIARRLEDSKPLEDVLSSLIKISPTLSQLFLKGQRLHNPHRKQPQSGTNGSGTGGDGNGPAPFVGKPHPTYFRFPKVAAGQMLVRDCEMGRRCRMTFETDVEDPYFSRPNYPGRYSAEILEGAGAGTEINSTLTLHAGLAQWSIEVPEDAIVGDSVTVQCTVGDDAIIEAFVNVAKLTVRPKQEGPGGARRPPRERTQDEGDHGGEQPTGISMPHIVAVHEPEWPTHKFDRLSACKVGRDGGTGADDPVVHTFYINLDNAYLKTEMKGAREDAALVEAKFKFGLVLVGLALLQDDQQAPAQSAVPTDDPQEDGPTVLQRIEQTTRALGPFLVPMINYLGALTSSDVSGVARAGDEG